MRNDLVKPYGWFNDDATKRPDPASRDYANVMAWLRSHGAPDPTPIYIVLSSGGWASPTPSDNPVLNNPGPLLYLQYPGQPQPFDAAGVLNEPGTVLFQLGLEAPGEQQIYHPPVPVEVRLPPPPAPATSPIGNYWFTDNAGYKCYYPAPGATIVDKAIWPTPHSPSESLFEGHSVPGPFGAYAWWVQVR